VIEDRLPARALFQSVALFAQDTFRISRLLVNVGARYSVTPAPVSQTKTEPVLVKFETLPDVQLRTRTKPLWSTSWSNVGPQIGVSYRLTSSTVLRGGWNLAFDALSSPGGTVFGRGYPFAASAVISSTTFPVMPDAIVTPAAGEVFAFPEHLRRPRTYEWYEGVDYSLGRTQNVSVSYVGALARDLITWYGYDTNGAHPIEAYDNTGRSDYQALFAQYVHRLSRGLEARLVYTWSHAIDTDSGEGLLPHPPPTIISPARDRGSADFDRRHVLHVSGSYRIPDPDLPRMLGSLCANWWVDVVGQVRSGAPVTVTGVRDLPSGRACEVSREDQMVSIDRDSVGNYRE
jgi:hypothetical protein